MSTVNIGLVLTLGVLCVVALSGKAYGADDFLFTEAGGYTTVSAPDADQNVKITLTSVPAQVSYYSTVPRSYAGAIDTQAFASTWADTPDYKPIAAIVGVTPDGKKEVAVAQLTGAPIYDSGSNTITYDAKLVLQNTATDALADGASPTLKNVIYDNYNNLATQSDLASGYTWKYVYVYIDSPYYYSSTGAAGSILADKWDGLLGRSTAFPQNHPWPR
eukprot:jgi/Botrbrau1/12885/Bobra.0299s0005.1